MPLCTSWTRCSLSKIAANDATMLIGLAQKNEQLQNAMLYFGFIFNQVITSMF